jgi:hypothetical protein
MRNQMKKIFILLSIFIFTNTAFAGVCDYRPSKVVAAGSSLIAATSAIMKTVGLYSLTNPAGATMLGSTAAGSTAAGTAGILGGTSGIIGTIGTVLLSPAVLITSGVVAVGSVVYEGVCYFSSS